MKDRYRLPQLAFYIFAVLAEFERKLIREQTVAGPLQKPILYLAWNVSVTFRAKAEGPWHRELCHIPQPVQKPALSHREKFLTGRAKVHCELSGRLPRRERTSFKPVPLTQGITCFCVEP